MSPHRSEGGVLIDMLPQARPADMEKEKQEAIAERPSSDTLTESVKYKEEEYP